MSHIHFAAWGSVDVESLERMQRRKYLQAIRTELAKHGITIEYGGQRSNPHYLIRWTKPDRGGTPREEVFAEQGMEALKKVMTKAIELLPAEVRDGERNNEEVGAAP